MSEVFITFMGLGVITTLQFIIVVNLLDRLEQLINALKEQEDERSSI